ncbi:hypothetical protein OUZ56_009500 [Daphnia magna]|uniref:C2H2-type domain-containing protein n=1 Tax=Daphnia magna TaxID=35525 RepID=A0ABR0AG62_9CRUS|nr:hypothetical protein OUZ56_009500 [Daphnia magna]
MMALTVSAETADVVLTYRMPSCNFLAACVPRLLSHYRTTRRYDSDFHLPCMYLNCDRIFNSESNLKKHYDKDHKVVERTTIVDPFNLLEVDDNQSDNFDQTRTGIPPDGDTQPYNKPLSSTDAPSTLQKAIYLLQLLEGRKLNQCDLQDIMLHTNTLVNNSVTTALSDASSILSEEGCTHTRLLDSLIDRHSSTGDTNIFEELKTPYRQKKFIKEEMGLIEPRLVTLPDKAVYVGRIRTGCPQKQKFQKYVPITFLEQLELLLNQDEIYSEVNGSKPKQAKRLTALAVSRDSSYGNGVNDST